MLPFVLVITILVLWTWLNGQRHFRRKLPPGPVGLPLVGYLPFLGPTPAIKLTELYRQYGDIFSLRLGSQLVIFVNEVETMREMGKMDNFLGRNQLEVIGPRKNCGLIFLEKEAWSEWRRFTVKTLREVDRGKLPLERLVLDQVEDFREFLKKNQNQPLYLQESVEIAALNALWFILAGEKFDLEDPDKKKIFHIITEGVSDQQMLGIVVFLPWLGKLFPEFTGWSKSRRCLLEPVEMVEDIVARHREQHSRGYESDFVDLALTKIYSTVDSTSAFYGEEGIRNLVYTLLDLFFTGSDTMSSTLGWAFLLMGAYPEVQRKVQEEIDKVIGPFNVLGVQDRPRMIYTEAVMMEIQRRVPMSPLGIMHTALEDVEFHSFTIPKRTVILWNFYHAHHDRSHWGDPERFRPERFINVDGTLRKDDHFIPFFTGKRSCPGEALAMNQYFLFFTGVLQKFNVELEDKDVQLDLSPSSTFIVRPPRINVVVSSRE